jgi:hypothetical protein
MTGRSPKLAAFVALAGPLDLLVRHKIVADLSSPADSLDLPKNSVLIL